MKNKLVTLIAIFGMITVVNAHDYTKGIGLRGGYYNGITGKYFMKDNIAVEGLLSSRWRGFEITGLYEIHKPAFDVQRLHWYYGGGAHIGFYSGDYIPWGTANSSSMVIGVDGIIGIEYNFTEIPINISLDWKPVINLIGDVDFWPDAGAISVRYVF